MSEPVRVGVLVDGPLPSRWQAELVEAIASEPGLQPALLLLDPGRRGRSREPWVLRAYRRLDHALHRHRAARFAPMQDGWMRPGVSVIAVKSGPPGGSSRLAPDGAAVLRERGLDVVVGLTDHGAGPDIAGIARWGLWAVAWGDGRHHGDEPAGLREMLEGESTTVVRLVAVDGNGNRREIDRTIVATHRYSLVTGRAVAVAAIRSIVLKRLRMLGDRAEAFATLGAIRADAPPDAPRRPLDNRRLVAPLFRFGRALARRLVERVLWDEFHWSIAIAPRSPGGPPDVHLRQAPFRLLGPSRDRFYADPFLFEHGGEEFLFLEVGSYRTGRGVIAMCRIGADGRPDAPRVVLERPYHLSYPLVFERSGEIFMIPETIGTRTVELYRCRRFPDEWVLDTTLLRDVTAADATVLEHDGRWWMFACLAPAGMSPDTELHLFHADDVRGPWQPHRHNPVVSDVRGARPAGRLWREDGSLMRPAQDCSIRYGHGLAFRRITTLTRDAYAEEVQSTVGPDRLPWCPRAQGIHTWNAGPRSCATDVCASRFRGERWLPWIGAR